MRLSVDALTGCRRHLTAREGSDDAYMSPRHPPRRIAVLSDSKLQRAEP